MTVTRTSEGDGVFRLPRPIHKALFRGSDDAVITLSPYDQCLFIFPGATWDIIDSKLRALSDFDLSSRRTKQRLRGYAYSIEPSQQNIRIPEPLIRVYINLRGDILILGQGDKLEVWDPQAFKSILSGIDPSDNYGSMKDIRKLLNERKDFAFARHALSSNLTATHGELRSSRIFISYSSKDKKFVERLASESSAQRNWCLVRPMGIVPRRFPIGTHTGRSI